MDSTENYKRLSLDKPTSIVSFARGRERKWVKFITSAFFTLLKIRSGSCYLNVLTERVS